ncbi:MAG: hypothetical protein GF317_00665 [Candidatus Lokiarchaeota archaeon]|nr:hypothetical protein [Candidatus Lokiarchaeota archaeon]MBD3198481.1 hypothetical protein [Candidatus Lokiarchaeota archaeon]
MHYFEKKAEVYKFNREKLLLGTQEKSSGLDDSYSNFETICEWKTSNGQKYLEIFAPDYYNLGILLGESLYDKILSMKRLIQFFSLKLIWKGITYRKLQKISKLYERFIPKYLRMEMLGISDSILDIDYDDILLQNCFMDILYGYIIPNISIDGELLRKLELGCTSFGVITQKGPLTAQNFDYSLFFKPTATFVHLITPRLTEIFSLRLGALLSLPIGMNNWGLSLRVNVVRSRKAGLISIPCSIMSRIALERCQDAEAFYSLQTKYGGTGSYNLLISDSQRLIALEGLSNLIVREDILENVVKSNTFLTKRFQNYLVDLKYSKTRQEYSEKRIQSLYKHGNGVISDKNLIKILSDNPIICRENPIEPVTLAFLTNKYFGLGNPKENSLGLVPFQRGG